MRIRLTRFTEGRKQGATPLRGWRSGGSAGLGVYVVLVAGAAIAFLLTVLPRACAAGSTVGTTGSVLWSSGFETGDLSEWTRGGAGGVENSGTGSVSVSTDVAHSGHYSGKLTITNATNQTQAARLFRWAESEVTPNAYYSAWYYFPQGYSGMIWWNVFQFKSKLSSTVNDPLWILNVGNRSDGSMYFYLYDWINRRSYTQRVMNIPVGRWTQVEAYYQQATDNTGRVTFWQDGVQILDLNGVVTKRPGDEIDWSVTNYTDNIDPSSATIYVDDAAISTNRLGPGDAGASAQPQSAQPAQSQEAPRFVLGFKVLAELLGRIAGQPLENEHSNSINGDTVQRATTGLMAWRKADNWTAFTDGYQT